MDASNPVLINERVTVRDLRNDSIELKKQDYAFLKKLVADGKRMDAPTFSGTRYSVDKAVVDRMETSGMIKVEKTPLKPPLIEKAEGVLVSKYHIQGVNMTGAYTRVSRVFMQRKRKRLVCQALLGRIPEAARHIESMMYTGGTPSGFNKRLAKWADRKPLSVNKAYKDHWETPMDVIKRCLPYDKKRLKSWNRPLSEMIGDVTINKMASAGPPWYRPKMEVLSEVFAALEEILTRVSDGSIEKWLSENREFLISECKNKMDRYKDPMEKTRPYWNFSSPMAILLSMPCQGFTRALYTFEQKGANAYGFSYAHGGGKEMWNWMVSADKPKFVCYGDDTRMVWRKDGILWCVDPDFEQMDGSIDVDTVNLTVDYVMGAYAELYGKSDLFTWVSGLWKHLAIAGDFLVDGTTVYTNPTGLRTGVVGTTLFDTVKSILAYNLFLESRIDPQDRDKSVEFFMKMGLKIKPGTWNPTLILEEPEEGALAVDSKFLGVKLRWTRGKEDLEPLPFVEEEDLIALVGNCRQQVLSASRTVDRRQIFDMARGYQVTAAFHHPRVWDAMSDLINETDAEIICMRVQANRGRGQSPDFPMLTGNREELESFDWVSSDGYPTVEFCKNVFLSPGNKLEGDFWIFCFPELEEGLLNMRRKKEIVPLYKVLPELEGEKADWATQMELSEKEQKIEDNLLPTYDGIEDVISRERFKIPKNFVKFRVREPETHESKQQKIRDTVEHLEEINHRILERILHYGHAYVAEQMVADGWVPTSEGNWSRLKDRKAKHITAAWSYDAARVLGGDLSKNSATGTTGSTIQEADVAALIVAPCNRGVIVDLLPELWKYPKVSGNVVSRTTAFFNSNGIIIDPETQVLSQNPARVRFEAKVRGVNVSFGYAVDKDKSTAKNALYQELYKIISVDNYGVLRYLDGGGNEYYIDPEMFHEDPPIRRLEIVWWKMEELGLVCEDCDLVVEGGLERYAWEVHGHTHYQYPLMVFCGGHTDQQRFQLRRSHLSSSKGNPFLPLLWDGNKTEESYVLLTKYAKVTNEMLPPVGLTQVVQTMMKHLNTELEEIVLPIIIELGKHCFDREFMELIKESSPDVRIISTHIFEGVGSNAMWVQKVLCARAFQEEEEKENKKSELVVSDMKELVLEDFL